MKTSILHRLVVMSVILLSRSFHGDSALADGCPAPSFAAARASDAGGRPSSVAAGDFNGDGKPDLAVSDIIGGGFLVLLGNGDGTFHPANTNGVAQYYSFAVADFNGDGKLD